MIEMIVMSQKIKPILPELKQIRLEGPNVQSCYLRQITKEHLTGCKAASVICTLLPCQRTQIKGI